MKIRFVYFNGKDSLVGKGIKAWTWILALARLDFESLKYNFSHVECWFPDEDGNFETTRRVMIPCPDNKPGCCTCHYRIDDILAGQCFSSTTRGDAEGVRFAPASEVLKHPERWMYQEFEVDEDRVTNAIEQCKKTEAGKPYDFAGIFGFFVPWNLQAAEKWYCSEICSYLAWDFGLTGDRLIKRISPRRLAKVLGAELKELK